MNDPGRYWQDIDDPNWSDEIEDRFVIELGLYSIEQAFRPRDEFDVDVHPETLRGKVLAMYDACDVAAATIRSTWYGRVLWRQSGWGGRSG